MNKLREEMDRGIEHAMAKYVSQRHLPAKDVIDQSRAEIVDAILNSLPKEKEGINVYKEGTPDEFYSCLECGGYDECDCEGFNDCLEQIKQLLAESKEV